MAPSDLPVTPSPYRYDAFLSHSQRDHGTVLWLRDVLSDYWVPGRRRRKLFLDRKSMGGGVLSEAITEGLRQSRRLIVCCSANARDSEWVDREVEEFLKTHTDRDVLICDVGPDSEHVIPRSIEALQARRGILRRPDLRGFPEQKARVKQKPAVEEALSLLTDILDFTAKDELVDTVARGRARAWRVAVVTVAIMLLGLTGGWLWLFRTVSGAVFRAERRILEIAAMETIDEPYLASTTRAFGLLDRRGAIDGLAAAVKDREFRGVVLAAGLASLPEPECRAAKSLLESVDHGAARVEPRAFLLAQKRCGGDSTSIDPIRPESLTAGRLEQWGRALAQTGWIAQAREILARGDFPRATASSCSSLFPWARASR